MDYPPKGNLLYPRISLHSPSFSLQKEEKTEKEKGFQKEKIKKKGTKNRKNFLHFFQLLLPKTEEILSMDKSFSPYL